MYKALYRTWRPMSFDDVISQPHITETLQNQVRTGKTAHAYLFTGSRGTGKTTCARILAKAVNCPHAVNGNPCLECDICKDADRGILSDVIEIDAASNNSVEDIRDLREGTVYRPERCAYKIYIIDEVHMLSGSAWGALLKVMEEPPAYAVILLLTTNGANFLQTILSRCVILNLKQIPEEEVERVLREQGIPEKRIQPILKLCRGNIGKARKMAESDDFAELLHEIMNLMQSIHRMTFEEFMAAVGRLSEHRLNIRECLDFIRLWYRDVLLFKVTNDINVLVFQESFRDIREVAQKSSFEGIENIMQAIDTATRRLEANVNFELTMELLLMAVRDN